MQVVQQFACYLERLNRVLGLGLDANRWFSPQAGAPMP
jgi:hypothetical protein